MPGERVFVLTGTHVPQPDGLLSPPASKGFAIRTERYLEPRRMSGECPLAFTGNYVPQEDSVVITSTGERFCHLD